MLSILRRAGRDTIQSSSRFEQRSDPLRRRTSSAIRGTSEATVPELPQTAAYSRLALATGQDLLWMARVIVKPFATIWSSPTSRVSPWAIVFVAIRPRLPWALSNDIARRKK